MRTKLAAGIAALIAIGAAQSAVAEEYTLLIYETPTQLALRNDPGPQGAAYWSEYAEIGGAMARAGVLKGGASLQPGAVAVVSEGGRTSASNLLGGYFIIDVPDRAAALEWAKRIPASSTGSVEVRAHAPARTGM